MSYAGDLTPQQAWDLLAADDQAVLVDVRTREEWHEVGVPDLTTLGRDAVLDEWVLGAGRGPNPTFLDDVLAAGVIPGRPVVLLCRTGVRSVAAAHALTAAGLGPAYNVLQGYEGDLGTDGRRGHTGWRADGLPWRTA